MGLSTNISPDQSKFTIQISGRFDFNLHRQFREAYKEAEQVDGEILVDLNGTEYMDSSALGMLLVLRDRSGGDAANISIVNCNDEIKKIFAISNMDQMFKIT